MQSLKIIEDVENVHVNDRKKMLTDMEQFSGCSIVQWVRDWVWSQTAWIEILDPSLISYVTLGKLVTLSEAVSWCVKKGNFYEITPTIKATITSGYLKSTEGRLMGKFITDLSYGKHHWSIFTSLKEDTRHHTPRNVRQQETEGTT